MTDTSNRLIVLTGGPGSGKTSLVDALARQGYATSVEAGRGIIQEQQAIDGPGLPWRDASLFAALMLSWEIRSYRQAQHKRGRIFFDRGIPDVIGYLRVAGLPVPRHMATAAETFRYHRRVFILPPWPEIYAQDRERKQTFEEAQRTYRAMVETYESLGYDLVNVPHVSIDERAGFILATSR
jgi:predicted ATPase